MNLLNQLNVNIGSYDVLNTLPLISAKNANKFRSNVVSVAIREKATLKESGTVLPPIEWQHNQVAEFSKVRIQLARHIAYSQTKERSPDKKRHKLPSKTNEQGNIQRRKCIFR